MAVDATRLAARWAAKTIPLVVGACFTVPRWVVKALKLTDCRNTGTAASVERDGNEEHTPAHGSHLDAEVKENYKGRNTRRRRSARAVSRLEKPRPRLTAGKVLGYTNLFIVDKVCLSALIIKIVEVFDEKRTS